MRQIKKFIQASPSISETEIEGVKAYSFEYSFGDYNKVDADGDTYKPGCWTKAVEDFKSRQRIPFAYNHTDFILGVVSSIDETTTGLKCKSFILSTPIIENEYIPRIRTKAVVGISPRFECDAKWNKENTGLNITKVYTFLEHSLTPYPAERSATGSLAKTNSLLNRYKKEIEKNRRQLEKAKRSIRILHDLLALD